MVMLVLGLRLARRLGPPLLRPVPYLVAFAFGLFSAALYHYRRSRSIGDREITSDSDPTKRNDSPFEGSTP